MDEKTVLRILLCIGTMNLSFFIWNIIEMNYPGILIQIPYSLANCIFIYMILSIIPNIISLIILIKATRKNPSDLCISQNELSINLTLHIIYLVLYIFYLIPLMILFASW